MGLNSVSQLPVLTRVLVANRGEIACRIIEGVQAAGYTAVAIYSDADAGARHVSLADEAIGIGGNSATESYLATEKVIAAAKTACCDAIHPGYGFLSENSEFARALQAENITFIGPSPESMQLMGNKATAKARMLEAGVPCIRGYQDSDQSDVALMQAAREIGFPLMVKAAAGGGGRGMRCVESEGALANALQSARQESLSAFGSEELILEQMVVGARHIEIQVAADAHGNVLHLAERDCSLQRRHQKVIEEAPSAFVDDVLRTAMGEAAVAVTRACDYLGVGTVEFLVDQAGRFSFLEMNTRLQVEHPVTEMVTGIDLVDWQLRIAAGELLPITQDELQLSGHAIEARIYAEDPAHNFMPQTGRIRLWQAPVGAGVRVDHGIEEGQMISPYYDSMLAKIICWGPNRAEARRRLNRALAQTRLLGVHHNGHFLGQLLRDARFAAGSATTDLIDREGVGAFVDGARAGRVEAAMAAVLWRWQGTRGYSRHSHWMEWSNTESFPRTDRFACGGDEHQITLVYRDAAYRVETCGAIDQPAAEGKGSGPGESASRSLRLLDCMPGLATMEIDGRVHHIPFAFDGETLYVQSRGQSHRIERLTYQPALSEDQLGNGLIKANLEGLVIAVPVQVGEKVERGQALVLVEAMKMEHRLVADVDGCVRAVHISKGTQVSTGQLLVELDPEVVE